MESNPEPGSLEWRVNNLEAEVRCLKRQVQQLRIAVHDHDEWIDTMSSSYIKRLWWALCGYRLHRVGRWRREMQYWFT